MVYLVEISKNANKVFILLFPNFEKPDVFYKEILTKKQASKVIAESGNSFENLVEKFYFKYSRL